MDRLTYEEKIFTLYEYSSEPEFERAVNEHSIEIFGQKSIYVDVKMRIGEENILSIPDGYLIDFSFESDPRLYIIENELVIHDPYKHIGQQLLKFAISYKASGRNIKAFLIENILKDKQKQLTIEEAFRRASYRNIDEFLENLIFEKSVAAIVIIDQITDDLSNVLGQLTMKTDIIEFQTFVHDKEHMHKFTPFQQEIRTLTESKKTKIKIEDLNTIVVPANQEGFNGVFLNQDCWYAIRISSSMIDRIKYIASYQTAPVSAITYYAEVKNIEKYKDTDKYIVYFREKAKKIGPIHLSEKKKGAAPQAPRYTNIDKLLKAKTLKEIWPI